MTYGIEPGILLVDKPVGKTSFAMVRAVRKIVGVKKVGHAGTLDPFATGLLVVCVGRPATKMISMFMDGEKEYVATLRLGAVSTTQDPEGEVTVRTSSPSFSEKDVDLALSGFTGEILQTPPSFSALKHKGKPLYHYARKGIMVEKAPRPVHIHALEWEDRRAQVEQDLPYLTIKVRCGKGTYIRTLAADIGEVLGCGAYLTALRRTKSGFFFFFYCIPGSGFLEANALDRIKEAIISVDDVRNLLQ